MVGAIAIWTGYTITAPLAPAIPPITSTALQASCATVVLGPIAVATHTLELPATFQPAASLVFIAVFPRCCRISCRIARWPWFRLPGQESS